MNNKDNNRFRVSAKDLNLTDLDFPECAELLKQHIASNSDENINIIELDIRWCVVIYSQSNVFIDSCLSVICAGKVNNKKLIFLTSNNYKTKDLTCYELFRTTKAANKNDNDPKTVTFSVNEFCLNNDLSIEIHVYSGATEDLNAREINCFTFPEVNL